MEFDGLNAGSDVALSNPNAFFKLGIAYATGRGVEWDLIAAHKWFNIAASLGHKEASAYRRDLAEEMLPAQIAEAQRRARAWLTNRQERPVVSRHALKNEANRPEKGKVSKDKPPRTVKRRRGKISLAAAAA